jgi:hypothetical protein
MNYIGHKKPGSKFIDKKDEVIFTNICVRNSKGIQKDLLPVDEVPKPQNDQTRPELGKIPNRTRSRFALRSKISNQPFSDRSEGEAILKSMYAVISGK